MQAMVLAAGVGSRLGELTKHTPKCLVEVQGKPILEWNLLRLKAVGISKIVINLYHLPEPIKAFLAANNSFGLEISLSEEQELLNTGGGLKNAEPLFNAGEPILIVNADILASVSLADLMEFHRVKGVAATLVTRTPQEPRVLLFEEVSHQLAGWRNNESGEEQVEKSTGHLRARGFCGVQVLSPVIFQFLGRPEEKRSTIAGFLDAIRGGEKILEFPNDDGYWFDIGTPTQLEECRRYFEENEVL